MNRLKGILVAFAFVPLGLLLLGQSDTQNWYGGGITLTIEPTDFNDCNALESPACEVLNVEGCHLETMAVTMSASLGGLPACGATKHRKIWWSESNSCADTTTTVYISDREINAVDTEDAAIDQYCQNSIDTFPNADLDKDVVFDTDSIYLEAGDACSDSVDTILYLCYAIGPLPSGGSVQNDQYGWHKFKIDTSVPPALTASDFTATSGESTIQVGWNLTDVVDDAAGLVIRYREGTSQGDANSDLPHCSTWETDATASVNAFEGAQGIHTIEELDNDKVYELCVAAVDDLANTGPFSDTVVAQPRPECDFWECAPDDIEGGACFIATAAYGPQDPIVATFRLFRDRFLNPNSLGRALARLYYSTSPPLAARISASKTARQVTRAMLFPFFLVARASLFLEHYPLGLPFGLLGVLCMTPLLWRRRRS